MEELLKNIGIFEIPEKSGERTWTIDIEDSNEFGRYYSLLDKSTEVEEDQESSTVTLDNNNIKFINDEYDISLIADFISDEYKLVIKDNKFTERLNTNPDDDIEGLKHLL